MTAEATPPPLLFIVPARRAIVRAKIDYDTAMQAWFESMRDMRDKLIEWYDPLRAPDTRDRDFGAQLDEARRFIQHRWENTLGSASGSHEGVLSPGSNGIDSIVPRARLWKGPMRVLLEQKEYGVLGRTLRRGPNGDLTPPWTTPMMEKYDVCGTGEVETDGTVKIKVKGAGEELMEEELRQEESGEVSWISNFLPGDLIEFPFFLVLANMGIPGFERARFNPMGSPFLGTSVDVAPEPNAPVAASRLALSTLRIHDNLIAMRFQLLLNLARGSFSSLRKTFNGAEPGDQTLSEVASENDTLDEENTEGELDDRHRQEILALRREDAAPPPLDDTQRAPLTERQRLVRERLRRELDGLAAAANQRKRAWELAQRLGQVHGHKVRYRRAHNLWYRALARYMALLDSEEERQERRYVQRRRTNAMVNYNVKAAHMDFTNEYGVKLFAHGILYGGSLTNTAPVRYGTPSRFFDNNWGHSRSPTKLTVAGKGFRAIVPLTAVLPDGRVVSGGDCDRLTLAWSCTPSTLATSYFLLHAMRLRAGGSVRSQFDASCSIFCEVDANGMQIAGAAERSRFYTFWPPGLREDGTDDPEEPGLPADANAPSEFFGSAQLDARRNLDSRSAYFEGREDDAGNPINPPFNRPGVRCPPGVPPALWRVWKERAAGGDGPNVFSLGIEQLRKYFLEQKQAQFTVVSLSGHEYMHVWLMSHALLAQESAVTAAGHQPWSTLYRPQPASTVDPQHASNVLYRTEEPLDMIAVTPRAEPPAPATNQTLTPTLTSDAQTQDPLPTSTPVPGQPVPQAPVSDAGQRRRMTQAEIRRAAQGAHSAQEHAHQVELPPEDYSPEHSVGQDLESETLWYAAQGQIEQAWVGPLVGPPVAGFLAAYDPLTGLEYNTSDLGDLYAFEAAGNRVPVTLPAAEGLPALSTVVMSGGPFRWEPTASITVLLGELHPRFGQELYISRDRTGTAPSEDDQKLQAFTHIHVDAMRALHKNPITFEPIHLFSRGQARLHAFTRQVLPLLARGTPEAENARREAEANYLAASNAVDAADQFLRSTEAASLTTSGSTGTGTTTGGSGSPTSRSRRGSRGDVASARRAFDAAYAQFEAAEAALRVLPLLNPEKTAERVAEAWHADRAVPFPTFFEARDDEQYFRKSKVSEQREPIERHLKQFNASPAAVAQLMPRMRKLLQSAVRQMD
jgi:hypothetical protein